MHTPATCQSTISWFETVYIPPYKQGPKRKWDIAEIAAKVHDLEANFS